MRFLVTTSVVAEGTAVITVKTADGNKTDTCTVTVTKDGTVTPPVEQDNVTVDLGDVAINDARDPGELIAGSGLPEYRTLPPYL